jgi:hypothetical protein
MALHNKRRNKLRAIKISKLKGVIVSECEQEDEKVRVRGK